MKKLNISKNVKDTSINVRLSTTQKKKFAEEAKSCNMKLSEYVLHLLENRTITVIENGSEIAKAMYKLNDTLNHCMNYPHIPTERAREAVTNSIMRLNACIGSTGGDYNVYTTI